MIVYLLTSLCQDDILQEHGSLMMLRWQTVLERLHLLHLHTEGLSSSGEFHCSSDTCIVST